MPDKPKNKAPRYPRYVAAAALCLAVMWLILGLIFFAAGWSAKPLTGFYLIYAVRDRTFLPLSCVVSPIITLILIVIAPVVIRGFRSCLMVMLMVAASIIFFVGAMPAVLTETYHDQLSAGDYVYYADSEWRDDTDRHLLWFVVRRCDSLGVMCDAVFAKGYYDRFDDRRFDSFNAHLIQDDGAVFFKFEGKVVYAEKL